MNKTNVTKRPKNILINDLLLFNIKLKKATISDKLLENVLE